MTASTCSNMFEIPDNTVTVVLTIMFNLFFIKLKLLHSIISKFFPQF